MGRERTKIGDPPKYAHEGHGGATLFVIVYSMLPEHTNIVMAPMEWRSVRFGYCFHCRDITSIACIFAAVVRRGSVEGSQKAPSLSILHLHLLILYLHPLVRRPCLLLPIQRREVCGFGSFINTLILPHLQKSRKPRTQPSFL
jgi:hypothetical protein